MFLRRAGARRELGDRGRVMALAKHSAEGKCDELQLSKRVYSYGFLPETILEKVSKCCADLERRAPKDFLSHLSNPLNRPMSQTQAPDLG